MTPAVMRAEECAKYLNVSYSYFRKQLAMRSRNLPPFVVVGTVRRWRKEDVDNWIASNLRT